MATREMKLYGNKTYGVKVSDYGLEHGYLRLGNSSLWDCLESCVD